MKKNIRVALSFATFTDDQLDSFAVLVIACLKTNPLFPLVGMSICLITPNKSPEPTAVAAAVAIHAASRQWLSFLH